MLNRYTSLPKATIQNTQVLADLGIIDSSLGRQQQIYDTQAANIAQRVQEANNLDFLEGKPQEFKEKINQDLKAKVGEWSSLDLADPSVKAKVNGYISELASNPELQYHTKAKTAYDNYLKESKELDNKGKLNPAQAYFKKKAWDIYSQTGELPDYATQSLTEGVDGFTERSKYFKDLRASGGDAIKFLQDGTAFKNSSKGISGNRTLQQASNIYNDYVNSQVGRQDSLEYDMLVDSGQLDGKKISKQKYLTDLLLNTGKTYEYSESSTNLDGALNSSRKEKKEKEDNTIPAETIGFSNHENLGKYRFTPDGNFVADDNTSFWLGSAFDKVGLTNTAKDEEMDNYQKEVMKIAKLNKVSPKEVVDAHAQYTTVPFSMYTKNQGESLTKALPGISLSSKVKIGAVETTLADYFKDKKGITLDSLDSKARKEALSDLQVIGEVRPDGKTATGYIIGGTGEQMVLDFTDNIIKTALSKSHTKDGAKELLKVRDLVNAKADAELKQGLPSEAINDKGEYVKVYPNFKNLGLNDDAHQELIKHK